MAVLIIVCVISVSVHGWVIPMIVLVVSKRLDHPGEGKSSGPGVSKQLGQPIVSKWTRIPVSVSGLVILVLVSS